MSQLEILCPNGHRVVVNVLDEACLKKGFLPCTDYELRHGKKVLGLSSSIQESSLPNHAKLELVKCAKPWVESKVLVQVQTSEGGRVQRDFLPSVTLFQLFESFEENDGRHTFREVSSTMLDQIKEQISKDLAYMQKLINKCSELSPKVPTNTSTSYVLKESSALACSDEAIPDKKSKMTFDDSNLVAAGTSTTQSTSGQFSSASGHSSNISGFDFERQEDNVVIQPFLHSGFKSQHLTDQPLMTQAMRKMEMEMKMAKYSRVIIRIQFPDRHVAQAVFRPRETVHALYKFVRELLVDKRLDFELYTTPPKQTLNDMTATLLESGMVPMTRVYLTYSSTKSDGLIMEEVLASNISSRLSVEAVVHKFLSEVSSASSSMDVSDTTTSNKAANQRSADTAASTAVGTAASMSAASAASKSTAVPKWLTMGTLLLYLELLYLKHKFGFIFFVR
ncbi:hypothetical protein HELRODRAFT_180278 [Helobdella robusta]|uniref:UBX domain-containing protein n=1 Tax=Helobdella robusta TaxID=6412 RepID=T1FFN9_HELRO|nr:hypothetical protein HELRODRAFT_180278 [Helobdella robusta]ESN94110.1 hypothetical protein HELRODRAFT_180278 [Helobdella robusta]